MSAFFALDFKIHSRTQHVKGIAAAGMIFLHNKLIAYTNVHLLAPFGIFRQQYNFTLYYITFNAESIDVFVIKDNINHIN